MIVELSKLTSAMQKVKSFAQDTKSVPGVLLNLGENSIKVCYSDGKKSVVETIDAIMSAEEQLGEIIVPYQVFMGMVDTCQPSGNILCNDLSITVKDAGILSVETTKFVLIINGEGDNIEEVEKPVSKFRQEIKFYRPAEDIRYGILSRMDYNSIFESENFDIWDTTRLTSMLSRLNKEDGKICYFSSQIKAAFVANLAHLSFIPSDDIEEFGFSLTTKMAKYLVEILNKIPDDKINIAVQDFRYCKITTGDDRVGIWFEMAPANKTDPMTLASYQGKQYAEYGMVFNRYALQDVVKRAIGADNTDTTAITFSDTEGGMIANIVNGGSASKLNDFSVVVEAYTDNSGKLLEAKLPVSLKAVSDIIDNCIGNYIMIDITDNESGKCLRFSDTSGRDENGNAIIEAYHYTLATR